jgi:hypothetical protein
MNTIGTTADPLASIPPADRAALHRLLERAQMIRYEKDLPVTLCVSYAGGEMRSEHRTYRRIVDRNPALKIEFPTLASILAALDRVADRSEAA